MQLITPLFTLVCSDIKWVLSRSESTIFGRTLQKYFTTIFATQCETPNCVRVLRFVFVVHSFCRFSQTTLKPTCHKSLGIPHLNLYLCGVLHFKGEVGKGKKAFFQPTIFFSAHPPTPSKSGDKNWATLWRQLTNVRFTQQDRFN